MIIFYENPEVRGQRLNQLFQNSWEGMVGGRDFIEKLNTITQWALWVLFIVGGGGIVFILGLVLAYMIALRVS